MSITDELRKRIDVESLSLSTRRELWNIADRIDAEHADMQAFCDRLKEAAQGREDVTLFDVDYVALPVDADGVPIRVGDEMEICGKPYRVWNLWLDSDKKWFLSCDEGDWEGDEIATLRHHYPPTVEDVLLEACKAYHGLMVESMCDVTHDTPAPSEVIAEYAAKLRLAGEDV